MARTIPMRIMLAIRDDLAKWLRKDNSGGLHYIENRTDAEIAKRHGVSAWYVAHMRKDLFGDLTKDNQFVGNSRITELEKLYLELSTKVDRLELICRNNGILPPQDETLSSKSGG